MENQTVILEKMITSLLNEKKYPSLRDIRRLVQTWKRHGIRCKHSTGRNAHIFLQRIFLCIST